MNYFAHYYFDYRQNSELHNFGLALPDFVRNFIKGKRIKPVENQSFGIEELQWLHEGTVKHIQRDAAFHGSVFFKEASGRTSKLLLPAFGQAGIPRTWWGAHVLTEMMLDRVLMKENPELIAQFYEDLEKTDGAIVNEYMLKHGIQDTSDFFSRLDRFRQLRYLLRYTEDDAMVYSLSRVYLYAGVSSEWTLEQASLVVPQMKIIEHEIAALISQLKEEMQ